MIDINCDMGEIPEDIYGGAQEALLAYVTSINVACGGHAGDERSMRTTVEQALRHKVSVGAHPSYVDIANFGRTELNLPSEQISQDVFRQVRALAAIHRPSHVKPHGALYNQAARDARVAQAIAEGVARWSKDVVLMGLAGSLSLEVYQSAGFRTLAEAFADRRYEADGSLRSRKLPGALIEDPQQAAAQAVEIARSGKAQSICIHGDTPGAVNIARAVREALSR